MRKYIVQIAVILIVTLCFCMNISAANLTGTVEKTNFYDILSLHVDTTDPSVEILYTTDGSDPNSYSNVYKDSIHYRKPVVVKAQAFLDGQPVSNIFVRTLAITPSKNIPIVSLVIDPDDFSSEERGIYTNPNERGKEWERKANIEIFSNEDPKLLISSGVGLRVHGGASRKRGAKKSLRLYFKDKYGKDSFDYPLFGVQESYKRLVLRAGFNDTWNYDKDRGSNGQKHTATYISDQIARDLHSEMGQRVSKGRFVILYINGEYFGLYNIVERIDEYFAADDIAKDDFATVVASDEVKGVNGDSWYDILEWLKSGSYKNSDFIDELSKRVDVESFISYMFLNIWLQNYDWPHHNWVVGQRELDAPWKFYIWDAEYSFGSGGLGYRTNHNTITSARNSKGSLGEIFKLSMKNGEFRKLFKSKGRNYMSTVLTAQNVKSKIDHYANIVQPYITKEARTWAPKMNEDIWKRAIKLAKDFARKRSRSVESFLSRMWF